MDERKARAREAYLLRTYGITTKQYEDLLEKQEGCCAICRRHHSLFRTRLAVDHNHVTKEVRGLCCAYCNHRLVGRHRDPDLLRRIADYISQGTGWYVPASSRKRKKKNGR